MRVQWISHRCCCCIESGLYGRRCCCLCAYGHILCHDISLTSKRWLTLSSSSSSSWFLRLISPHRCVHSRSDGLDHKRHYILSFSFHSISFSFFYLFNFIFSCYSFFIPFIFANSWDRARSADTTRAQDPLSFDCS